MKRILFFMLLCISTTMVIAQTTWTGAGANTNWNTTDNWDTNLVPTAADDVIIPTGFTVTLNVAGNVKSIDVQGNAVFDVNNNLTFTDASTFGVNVTVNWANGSINGSANVLTNLGVINLTTGANHIITGGTTLENQGTLNITSAGDLFLSSASILNIPIGGVMDMQADAGNITWSGTPGVINNAGLIRKTTSTGEAQIVIPINNNDGTIQVEVGTLSFQNPTGKNFNDGTYNVFSGATMDWDTTINTSGSLTGTIAGNLNWNSIVNIPSGETAAFNFSEVENFNWTSGTLSGGGTLTNTNVLKLTTTANHVITGGTTLENQGTLNITSAGDLFLSSSSILNNPVEGVIDMQADAGNITWSGTPGVINNVGLIKKTTSTGEAQIVIPINNNDGTIQVEVGTLSFQNPTGKNFNDGTYNVFLGATMDWDTTINPSGSLTGTIAGNLNWNNIVNVVDGTFAAFNFDENENFNWTSGTLSGGGTLTNTNVLNLTTGANHVITGGTTLENQGTLNITSAGDLFLSSSSILNNPVGGIMDMQADAGNITWSGEPGVINNAGLIKKTTSTGEAQIVIPINNNDGTIQVEVGTLSFQNPTGKNFNDGTYNVFLGATMDWDTTINPSGSLTGTIVGNLNWNNIVNVEDGTFTAFNFGENENFNWTSGTLSGGGTLTNTNVLNLTTGANHVITGGTTLENQGTLNITSTGDLFLSSSSILNNPIEGVIDMQADAGNITWSGTPGVINNAGLIKRTTSAGIAQILIELNNSGLIEVVSGELEHTGNNPFTNEETGIVKGIGIFDLPTVANYTNNGTFAPGLSPGTLTVQGDFISTTTSVLDIELDGLTPDTEHDVLAIIGNNNVFEGSVNVTMGFEGTIGDAFTVATTSGTIATANLQSPIENVDFDGKRYTFDVSYPDNNKVVLTITDKLDILPPNVITQNITVELDNFGNVTIQPLDVDNGTTDNCTPTNELQFDLDITNFTCADLGDNTVQLTVTDNDNNFATVSAIVTVEDNIAPTVLTQDITIELDASGNASISPSAIDNGSNDNCTVDSLDVDISAFTCNDLGDNTVELTVTDQSGNSALATAIVTVEDNLDPTALVQNIVIQLDTSGNATISPIDIDNGSNDNCTVDSLDIDISAFTCDDLGDNTVELIVTDQSGNTDSAFATVTVLDTISPTITCPAAGGFIFMNAGDYTVPDYVGDNIIAVDDNCSFDVVQTPTAGTVLPDGDYTISIVVIDASGNEDSCLFELKVRDTTLSLDEQQVLENEITLFPNPVVDVFTIKNTSRLDLVNLEIIDLTGKIINRIKLNEMDGSLEVSIKNYAKGVYLVKINAINSSITKRLIKQ